MSGGSPAGIHGLFSGWYYDLASRKVTLRVSMAWAKGVTIGTLVRYETSCSHLPIICVIDWICMLACKHLEDVKIDFRHVIISYKRQEDAFKDRIFERDTDILSLRFDHRIHWMDILAYTKSKENMKFNLKLVVESLKKEKLMLNAAESVRDAIRFEYYLASLIEWTKGTYESDFGGYNESMCYRERGGSPVLVGRELENLAFDWTRVGASTRDGDIRWKCFDYW
ncbi:hypothetical protein Tco_0161834 [Tanacetum coccineum]